jgi:hypothetical protein
MRLDKWEKNPLIFYMHHMGIPLAKAEMFLEDGQLWALDDFDFHRKEIPVFGFGGFGMFDTGAIADLWEEEFLNAMSIHIILSKQDEQSVIETEDEIVIATSEVIEASVVTVPGDADAVREKEYLEELAVRLRAKGIPKEMAECVACSFGDGWTPSLPVWSTNEQSVNDGSVIRIPEVSMNKKEAAEATLETAEEAEATPVETAEKTAVEGATLETTEEVIVEHEFQLPVVDLAQAIAQDEQATRVIAEALIQMPEFVQSIVSAVGAQTQSLEPVAAEVLPRKITLTLVGSGDQRPEAQVQQPAQSIVRPTVITQAVEQPVMAAPVALPAEQNGVPAKRPSALDLLPPTSG